MANEIKGIVIVVVLIVSLFTMAAFSSTEKPEPTQTITKWYCSDFSEASEARSWSHKLFKQGWRNIKIIPYTSGHKSYQESSFLLTAEK